MVDGLPRGIRNYNPTNIQYGAFAIEHGAHSSDGRFAIFPSFVEGMWAAADLLLTYQSKYGITTTQRAIERWAPGTENDVAAYVSFVDGILGCGPDDQFDFRNRDFLFWMLTAMGEMECGTKAFTMHVADSDIDAGIEKALA